MRWKGENTQVALKLEHRQQLGLKGSVSGAPVFLETVALLPFLAVRSSIYSDLSQVGKLLFSSFGSGWRHQEGPPIGLKLMLKLLELRGRGRKAFDLETLEIAEFFVKPRCVMKVLMREVGKSNQYWTMVR
jgi:hypothetical protein